MSIVIKHEDKSKEYYLNQISSVGGGSAAGSGLYLRDDKIVDEHGNDITPIVDTILTESIAEGDMIIEYEE